MRPEKHEVADPRFSKSTALALEKQARERQVRSRAAGEHAVRVAAWPSPWRHLCLWSSPPSQAHEGKSQLGEARFKWACGCSLTGYVYKGAQLTEDGQDGFAR